MGEKRTWRRPIMMFVVAIGLFLVLLFGLALWLLNTETGIGLISDQVETAIAESVNGTVSMKIEPASGLNRIAISEFTITDVEGTPFIHVPRISASYSISGLVVGTIELTDVVAEGVVVNLRTENGRSNFGDLFIISDTPNTFDLAIVFEDAEIKDTALVYFDADSMKATELNKTTLPDAKLIDGWVQAAKVSDGTFEDLGPIVIAGLDLLATGTIETSGDLELRVSSNDATIAASDLIGRGGFSFKELEYHIRGVTMGAKLTALSVANRVSVEQLKFTGQLAESDAFGFSNHELEMNSTVSRGWLAALVPGLDPAEDVTLNLKTTGALPTKVVMSVDVNVAESALHLDATLANVGDKEMSYAAVLDARPAILEHFVPLPIDAKFVGRVAGNGEGGSEVVSAKIEIESFDFDDFKLGQSELVGSFDGEKVALSESTIRLDPFSAIVSGDFSMNGDFNASISTRVDPEKKVVSASVKADAKSDMSGSIDLDAETLLLGIRDFKADGTWNLAQLDSDAISVRRSKGRFDFALTPRAGTTRNAAIRVNGDGSRVRLQRQSVGMFDVDADIKTVVDLETLSLESLLAKLRGSADVAVSAVRVSGAKVRSAKMRVDAKASKRGFDYTLDSEVYGLETSGFTVDHAKADLDGFANVKSNGSLRNVKVSGRYDARRIDAAGNKVSAIRGEIGVEGPPSDLIGETTFEAKDVDAFGYLFDDATGEVTLKRDRGFSLLVKGRRAESRPKEVTVRADGNHDASYRNWELDDVDASLGDGAWALSTGFSFKEDQARFDDVAFSRGDQRVEVDGVVDVGESQALKIDIDKVDIRDLAESFAVASLKDVRGTVSGKAEIAGSATEPSATFQFAFTDLYFRDRGPVDVAVSGRYDDELAIFDSVTVTAFEKVSGNGSGEVGVKLTQKGIEKWSFDAPLRFQFAIDRFDVGAVAVDLLELSSLRVAGKATASLSVDGTLRNPNASFQSDWVALSVTGIVDELNLDVGPIDASWRINHVPAGRLTADAKISVASGGAVSMRAEMDAPFGETLVDTLEGRESKVDWMAQEFVLDADAERFDLSKLNVGPLADNNVEGDLTIDLRASGTVGKPTADGTVDLDGFGYGRFRDVLLAGAYNLNEAGLSLEKFALGWDGDDVIEFSAALPDPFQVLSGSKDWETTNVLADITLLSIPIAKLSAFDYQFAAIPGKMSGTTNIRGTARDIDLSTALALRDVKVADGAVVGFDFEGRLVDGEATISGELTRDKQSTMTFGALFPLNADLVALSDGSAVFDDGIVSGSLKIESTPIEGLAPSALLSKFVEDVGGKIDADISLSGTRDEARFNGEVNVVDAQATIPSVGRRFEQGSLGVQLMGDAIRVVNFYIQDGTGFISGNGETKIKAWRPESVKMKVTASRFGIEGFSSLPAYISGKIDVDGNVTESETNAKMTISELEFQIPSAESTSVFPTELDEDIIVLKRGEDRQGQLDESDSRATVADEIYAKLNVRIEDDAWMRHPLGEVRFQGDLELAIANIGPMLRGEISTLEGNFETFGKTFEVDKGLVTFRGLDPPDPSLQIEAVHKYGKSLASSLGPASNGQPRAIIRITGRTSNPQMRFLSDPAMPEQDVIYVLVTDRAPGAAGVGQTEAGLVAGAAASGLTGVASLVAGKMNKLLPKIAQVDVVRLESGAEGFRDSRLEVGKYLTPKFFLVYEYQFGADEDENENTGRFEYRFLPRWIFEVEVGDRAQGEFNVLWDVY